MRHVKVLSRGSFAAISRNGLRRQLPDKAPEWGNCRFFFDMECDDYDWLVIYHDLPHKGKDHWLSYEELRCPRERTLLLTGEPSSITVFGREYLRQFGCVLTSQEPWAMRGHPNVIYHHAGLHWHYGLPFDGTPPLGWDALAASSPPEKTKTIATVCSQRVGKPTLHSARVRFTRRLHKDIPEMDVFGHGVKNMVDKAEALDPYKYHITVENHIYPHHLTEKLPDAFLGYTLPFYHGAPNAAEYFPRESFIPIDILNYPRSRDIIKSHIRNNEYEDRLPYIREARRRVLEKENLFAILARIIEDQEEKITPGRAGGRIYNRQSLRLVNPLVGIHSLAEKAVIKSYHMATYPWKNRPKKEL
jgi:hypothetical protein